MIMYLGTCFQCLRLGLPAAKATATAQGCFSSGGVLVLATSSFLCMCRVLGPGAAVRTTHKSISAAGDMGSSQFVVLLHQLQRAWLVSHLRLEKEHVLSQYTKYSSRFVS